MQAVRPFVCLVVNVVAPSGSVGLLDAVIYLWQKATTTADFISWLGRELNPLLIEFAAMRNIIGYGRLIKKINGQD